VATLPLKTKLYRELKLAIESGATIPEFAEKDYVYWKEEELQELHNRYLNPDYVAAPPEEPEDDAYDLDAAVAAMTYDESDVAFALEAAPKIVPDEVVVTQDKPNVNPALNHAAYEAAQASKPQNEKQTYTDWVSEVVSDPAVQAAMAAYAQQTAAPATAPDAAGLPDGLGMGDPSQAQSGAPVGKQYAVPREQWSQVPPRELARLLKVPFSDKAADRAGLTFNTHGPDDILRIDSRGMVWFKDEVPKPAIPKRRMRRKVKTIVGEIEQVQTYRPDGGLDETFEVDGGEKHEIEIKISMPASQVGIYLDPRMPFKIHQYNGRRAFDYDEVMRYYGGSELVPSSIKTIYIDIDLCFEIKSVRDTIERAYREEVLGRSILR
jgi:hypothetical protein